MQTRHSSISTSKPKIIKNRYDWEDHVYGSYISNSEPHSDQESGNTGNTATSGKPKKRHIKIRTQSVGDGANGVTQKPKEESAAEETEDERSMMKGDGKEFTEDETTTTTSSEDEATEGEGTEEDVEEGTEEEGEDEEKLEKKEKIEEKVTCGRNEVKTTTVERDEVTETTRGRGEGKQIIAKIKQSEDKSYAKENQIKKQSDVKPSRLVTDKKCDLKPSRSLKGIKGRLVCVIGPDHLNGTALAAPVTMRIYLLYAFMHSYWLWM